MDLLLTTYHQADIDFCWVRISPEMADIILGRIKIAKMTKQNNEDFAYMAFHSGAPSFYSHSDLENVGLEDNLLDTASDTGLAELDHKNVAMIEKADIADVDSTKIIIWSDGDVVWHGYWGDGNLIESGLVLRETIEEISLEHPRHLLKVLAFAPKNLV